MAVGELLDQVAGERAEDASHEVVAAPVVDAVQGLEAVEEDEQLLQVIHGEHVVDAVEGVRHRVKDVVGQEVVAQLVDVAAQRLDVGVLRFADADRQAMDLAAVLRERDGHLFGEEGARQVGDLERAGDGVVVAQRDEVHAALAAQAVDFARLGEALGRPELAQDPLGRAVGSLAVNVQIGFCRHRRSSLIPRIPRRGRRRGAWISMVGGGDGA